jgi:thiamine-phosphate pyrophosphorylase
MSAPKLFVITPPLSPDSAFAGHLAAFLAAAPAACIWLRAAPGADAKVLRQIVEPLAAVAATAGAAVLVDPPADERQVARLGADGVHLVWSADAVKAALAAHRPDRIVGAGGLRTRDDAMAAGEAGVDYVMFGEPRADGSLPGLEGVLERCQWWAEIFNTPAVGYAPSLDAVAPLAATGVEFIAVGEWAFADPAAVTETAAKVRAALTA